MLKPNDSTEVAPTLAATSRRNNRTGASRKRNADELDNFPMTQDDFADKVVWQTQAYDLVPKPSSSISSSSLLSEIDDGFGWKGLRAKRRKDAKSTTDIIISNAFLPSVECSSSFPIESDSLQSNTTISHIHNKENEDIFSQETKILPIDNDPPTPPYHHPGDHKRIKPREGSSQQLSHRHSPPLELAPIISEISDSSSITVPNISFQPSVIPSKSDITISNYNNRNVNNVASVHSNTSGKEPLRSNIEAVLNNHVHNSLVVNNSFPENSHHILSTISAHSYHPLAQVAAAKVSAVTTFRPPLPSSATVFPEPNSISIPNNNMNHSQQQSTVSAATVIEDIPAGNDSLDFSEEDLAKLDAQIAATQAAMGIFPDESSSTINHKVDSAVQMQSVVNHISSTASFQSLPIDHVSLQNNDIIDISEADLAMLDAIEQQVLSAHNGNTSIPPISRSTSFSSSSYKIWKMDEIPLYFRLKIISIEKSDFYRRTRMVVTCYDDDYSPANSKSTDNLHNATVTAVSDPIFIDLVEDWYHFSITDGDMLQSGEIIHIVNIDGLVLQSPVNKSNYPNPTINQNKNAIVSSLQPLTLRISNEAGLLIVAPDTYVSPTKVADSCQCARRGVLVDRFRSFSLPSVAATMGKVRHYFIERLSEKILQILQEVTATSNHAPPAVDEKIVFSRFPPKFLQSLVLESIAEHVEELYSVQKKDEEVKKDLFGMIAQVVKTMVLVFREGVSETANRMNNSNLNNAGSHNTYLKRASSAGNAAEADYQLQSIHGIEESIQSPILGIKGQVDLIAGSRLLSVQTTLTQYGFGNNPHNSIAQKQQQQQHIQYMLPLEIKTGKWKQSTIISHRAQVILYLLLMGLRQKSMGTQNISNNCSVTIVKEEDVARQGLLLYIAKDEVKVDVIHPSWMEMRSLILARNKLACQIQQAIANIEDFAYPSGYLANSMPLSAGRLQRLPPLKYATFDCTNCYSAAECMLSHAALEQGQGESSGVPSLLQHVLRGILAHHLQYWLHWDRLLDLETFPSDHTIRTHLTHNDNSSFESNRNYKVARKASMFTIAASVRQRKGESSCSGLYISQCLRKSLSNISNATIDCSIEDTIEIDGDNNNDDEEIGHALHQAHDLQVSIDVTFTLSSSSNNINSNSTQNIVDQENLRSLPLNQLFVTGDRLLVSLEKLPTKISDSEAADFRPEVNANICSGYVVSIQLESVTLRITQGQRYFSQLLSLNNASANTSLLKELALTIFPGWSFRLDKDESNVNIATMRANLTDLFIEPYLPSLYFQSQMRNKQQSSHTVPGLSSNDKLHQTTLDGTSNINNNISNTNNSIQKSGQITVAEEDAEQKFIAHQIYQNQLVRQRLRAFIVDFETPSFDPPPRPDKQFMLFCPPTMAPAVFVQAMSVIRKYKIQFQRYDLRSDPSTGNDAASLLEMQALHSHRGPHGEFIVQPGPLIIYPGCHPFELHQEYMKMNPDQQQAIQRILLAKDYALLRGLPGTGKTNTLALVVRMMIARQETVVLTSYTHNAVDHLLKKLITKGMLPAHVVRLGSVASIAKECLPYALQYTNTVTAQNSTRTSTNTFSIADLTQKLQTVRLFAGTVFTASRHMLLRTLTVKCDWCVVDEAGQITQPAAIGALLKAKKFVLVGDEKQLPPLVISTEAQKRGMDESLLQRLLLRHPEAAVTLTFQYRMQKDIMSLCNRLVYDTVMQCGSEEVAKARLVWSPHVLTHLQETLEATPHGDRQWLMKCVDPAQAVVWVNTDHVSQSTKSSDDNSGNKNSGRNEKEALLVQQILHAVYICQWQHQQELSLIKSDNNPMATKVYEIAVITPFRAQVHYLQSLLQQDAHLAPLFQLDPLHQATIRLHLEVSTVDKFQGKDKDVVIFSTVKKPSSSFYEDFQNYSNKIDYTNTNNQLDEVGYLLRDWRRVNVAITRAKLKLIVLASSTLARFLLQSSASCENERMLGRLYEICNQDRWSVDIPPAINVNGIFTQALSVIVPFVTNASSSKNTVSNSINNTNVAVHRQQVMSTAHSMQPTHHQSHQPPRTLPMAPPASSTSSSAFSSSSSQAQLHHSQQRNNNNVHNNHSATPSSIPRGYHPFPHSQQQSQQQQLYYQNPVTNNPSTQHHLSQHPPQKTHYPPLSALPSRPNMQPPSSSPSMHVPISQPHPRQPHIPPSSASAYQTHTNTNVNNTNNIHSTNANRNAPQPVNCNYASLPPRGAVVPFQHPHPSYPNGTAPIQNPPRPFYHQIPPK